MYVRTHARTHAHTHTHTRMHARMHTCTYVHIWQNLGALPEEYGKIRRVPPT